MRIRTLHSPHLLKRCCLARSSRAALSVGGGTTVPKAPGPVQDRLTQSLPIPSIQPSVRNPRTHIDNIGELMVHLERLAVRPLWYGSVHTPPHDQVHVIAPADCHVVHAPVRASVR